MLRYGPVTILGELASKSNSRQIVRFGSRMGVRKGDDALAWVKGCLLQLGRCPTTYGGPVAMQVFAYYKDNRRDLDIALLQDCLQDKMGKAKFGAGIIVNDRQIKEIHAFRRIDKDRPRVEFSLRALTHYKS